MNRRRIRNSTPPVRQRGIVLAVALILLAVIGLGSVAAMNSGLFGGLIASNLRSNQLAVQAAELSLRYCERLAMMDPPGIVIQPLPPVNTDQPTLWTDMTTWTNGTALTLPADAINSSQSDDVYPTAPQCLVEAMELRAAAGSFDEVAYLITARGFSPNYQAEANQMVSGSEVWLQSTIRFTP